LKKEYLDFLYSLIDYEKIAGYNYDLDAYKNFLSTLDMPQQKLGNTILIGGTKGKGSTAAILSACLQNNGYRVGLYTSPHLRDMNERIKVNDCSISDADFERQLKKIMPVMAKTKGARSFFEALTTSAFLYFGEKQVDFSVLEVGLGGRLDATNAADPTMSVITRIGYDHTNLLGSRLGQIATEKAGIIRERGTLITIHHRPAVERVIRKIAAQKKSKIVLADRQHKIRVLAQFLDRSRIRVDGKLGRFDCTLPLPGTHQIENATIALAVLSELQALGFPLGTDAVRRGIGKTSLHGRFEVISRKPLLIFDCAHNEDSFKALEQNLLAFKIHKFYLVFGSSRDKDIRYCLQKICPKAKHVFVVKADNPRAMEPHDLLLKVRKYQEKVTALRSVRAALDQLLQIKEKPMTIIVTGSFYLWQGQWMS
jgi:dihydrofolate synthase/folylpolyglutamate synthase